MIINARLIKDWFFHRSDVFARQQKNGAYFPVRRPITINDIEKHLKGDHSLGAYCLALDNTIKWACVDIDIHGKVTVTELRQSRLEAVAIYNLFNEYTRILESSGRRGYHVWIFFKKPVQAEYGQRLVKAKLNLKGLNRHEVFPKQTELNATRKYGNLVKVPLGLHLKSGRFSKIIKIEVLK